MTELKTQKNNASVAGFLASVENETRRKDAEKVMKLMQQVTRQTPSMWGTSIIGFGSYHYKSERSRQEGEWFMMGLSPRKANLTLYIMPSILYYPDHLKKLGKHKTGGSCLYINKLEDVDMGILKDLLSTAWKGMKERTSKKKQ